MGNLRILNVEVIDSTNIKVTFTDNLVPNLGTSNVSIIADTPNVPDAQVQGVRISGANFSINCLPLSPLAAYFLEFRSTNTQPFISIHGESRLPEDGVTNRYLILGPLDSDNPVRNYLGAFLNGNIYDIDDENTVVNKYVKALSVAMSRALYDIRQVKNENYLSFTTIDERKIRGPGAFDRLNQEGAYEIIRLGRGPTTANAVASFSEEEFPSFPITLQRQQVAESVSASSLDQVGTFNINSLTFNLSSYPVTRVTSIIFTFATINPIYTYDIETLGYQIKDSRYDQDFAFSYLQLEDNQVRINDVVLQDPNFTLDSIVKIDIQYESKNLGIVVDAATVKVTTVLSSIREVLPPIINIFDLGHAPVVTINGTIPILDGVTFIDPNTSIPGTKHPAFKNEITFRLNALPAMPGQYSIDYVNGTVYVYGENLDNNGTGPFPPLATYNYQLTYNSELDYVYDPDLLDLVALPLGNLVNSAGTVSFSYEEVLVPGVDYKSALHQEELTERIGNKLLAVNVLRTKFSPITNVFRIFNETSGEIYTLNRWNNDKVYFRYNTPPRIDNQLAERVTFNTITNELLFVNTSFNNTNSLKIFKIYLNNNSIISSTEDGIASSFNTSLSFSDGNIFTKEKWYNRVGTFDQSTNNLEVIGEYTVDYENGIVYLAVSNVQDFNIGTVTYKKDEIVPQFPNLISVEDLYYQISSLNPKNKQFAYVSFDDGSIVPENLDPSDELFLNDNLGAVYQLNGGSVGIFYQLSFIPGVTNQVNFVRSVFEYQDLVNSTHPINFASVSLSEGFNITVSEINKEFFDNVQYNISDGYFVTINENVPYLSSNITYTFSVVRVSDNLPLWDNTGTVVPGDPIKLLLPGINSPATGDLVKINYTFSINDLSRVVVDYNKGDFFADYTYLADEIIVSYEYGDNVIDFRTSESISHNTEYYVSYKAGALRDALLKNFGTLVNIPELANFDINFNRERYRDALTAALSSFIQGPTVNAIKNIGKTISHIEPEIIESIFAGWSLGNSLLNPEGVSTNGSFQLLPAKYGDGVLINLSDQTISMPASSNLRLEEGTFEVWIAPQWNGLDNDSQLTFNITKDGYAIDSSDVFVGAGEIHPDVTAGVFTLDKLSYAMGKPNTNKDGIFVYYDLDISGQFSRWYIDIIDGYVSPTSSSYRVKITSEGVMYNAVNMVDGYLGVTQPSNFKIFTGVNSITASITGGSPFDYGITFLSDSDHYLLDLAKNKSQSRLSVYKDVSGYINFITYDKDKVTYHISADISNWKSGDLHHVATSWKLNTRNNRDEMHLFIDGLEVPNIIKYGQKLRPYLHEKFRTVNPEEIVGLANYDIVGSNDLHTTLGSTTVTSSINFGALNLAPGNTIFIDEAGFDPDGYIILSIAGQSLVLNTAMPVTLTDARFSINRTAYDVTSDINIAPNIAVSTIHYLVNGSDLTGTIGTNTVSSATNFTNAGVLAGYSIRIDDPSLPLTLTILAVSGTTLTIEEDLPVNLSGVDFWVYSTTENEIPGVRSLNPSYSISQDGYFNNILTVSNDVFAEDLVLIRTLGLNHRTVKKQYYIWGDGYQSVLMTRMPPPISLDEVKITKIIAPVVAIGPSNSTLVLGKFIYDGYTVYQPTNMIAGRTISVTTTGNNTDFSSPIAVTINGTSGMSPTSETLNFTDYGTLDFTNAFTEVDSIHVVVDPLNPLKAAANVVVREKYPMTTQEFGSTYPVIKYSYYMTSGYNLYSDGYSVDGYSILRDDNKMFSGADIGNILYIGSPGPAAGFYSITAISTDRKAITIDDTLPNFTGGVYQVLNTTSYRSGLQNGYFNFEVNTTPSIPYLLYSGFYELEYATYARIKFDPLDNDIFIGSDFNGNNQANAILDQIKIYSTMLTDTRIGEIIPTNQRSITKDFNSLKALKKDSNTLVLLDFNSFPFVNSADYYINSTPTKEHFQSSMVVNENFNNSVVILDKPIIISNDGILDTRKEGTIEFWVSPIYDTGNDPVDRFYFDAYGAVIEDVVSVDNASLKLSGAASRILRVTLAAGDPEIDYFAGGKIEIDTQRALQENRTSVGNNIVVATKLILQVITVKIVGDLSNTDYFADGSVGPDNKTIYLGKLLPASNLPLVVTYTTASNNNDVLNTQVIRLNRKLPYQNTPVRVAYLPKGLQGDRLSIYKDNFGYINFGITASGNDYVVRGPTRWVQDTWHRVKASYKLNSSNNKDEMRLFLDGYEYTNVLFGSNIIFGDFPIIMGASMLGDGYLVNSIKFKDPINELFIGSQYTQESPIFSLIDNFRISNISRPIYAPYGEPLDVSYSSNLANVFPVTEDLFTTYLLNFDELVIKNTDFTTIQNRETGLFDFSINIFDSLGIINSSIKSKEALEKLIKVLKPANSRVFIQYIK